MCKWNKNLIEENLQTIIDLKTCSQRDDHIALFSVIINDYNKIMNLIKEKESSGIEDTSDKDSIFYRAIERVGDFLKDFNEEYYICFTYLANNGFISLNNGESNSEHFIDPVNKDSFIYVSSNDEKEIELSLIRQFGYVYQAIFNEKECNESNIKFIDAFPTYLEMSLSHYYDPDSKEEIINKIMVRIQNLFEQNKLINKELETDSRNNELRTKRKDNSKEMTSNYMALNMFKNNDIEITFNNIDKFVNSNHNGTSTSELWEIAHSNTEGINHTILNKVY